MGVVSTQPLTIEDLAKKNWEGEIPFIPGNTEEISLENWRDTPLPQKIKVVAEFLKNQEDALLDNNNCALIVDYCWKKLDEFSANSEVQGREIIAVAQAIFQLSETEVTKAKRQKLTIQFDDGSSFVLPDYEVVALRRDSEFFERMLGGGFKESKLSTITLKEISKKDFQALLNAQYGPGPQNPNEALRLILAGHALQLCPETCVQMVLKGLTLYPKDLDSLLYLGEVYKAFSISNAHLSQKTKDSFGQRLANCYLYFEGHPQEFINQLKALPLEALVSITEKENLLEEDYHHFYRSQMDKCLEFYKHLNVEKLVIRIGTDQAVKRLIDESRSLQSLTVQLITVENGTLEGIEHHLKLKELVLAGCNRLTNQFVLKVANLPILEKLNLSGCSKITDLSIKELSKIPELKSLNVSHCYQFTDASLVSVVRAPKFEHLDARYCRISKETISACVEKNQLKSLLIAGCEEFETWIEEVSKLTSLETLDLSFGFNLTDKEFDLISKMPNIKHLCLNNCTALNDESLAMIASMASLISLDIDNCRQITRDGFPLLIKLQQLEGLNVKGCEFEDESLIVIANFMPQLKYLVLDRCASLTAKSFKLVEKMTNLKFLSLVSCSLIDVETVEEVIKQLKLERLNLSECSQVDDELLKTIAKQNQQLQVLSLEHLKQITDSAIQAVATLPNLKKLNLLNCEKLTDLSMKSLLESEALCELDIRACSSISDQMIQNLIDRTELRLSYGEIKVNVAKRSYS